jgi:hypothetical protein
MHLGDETAIKDISSYSLADFIFRHYYHPQIFQDPRWAHKINWLPNGYRNGLAKGQKSQLKQINERKHLARFIGWLANPKSVGNERIEFERIATRCSTHLNCIATQGFAGGFSPHLYQYLMEDSIFAPCPAGNAAETIRIFDVLECGCIPISLNHEFLANNSCMGGIGIPLIESWAMLPDFLETMNKNRKDNIEQYTAQQKLVFERWQNFKLFYRTLVLRMVE